MVNQRHLFKETSENKRHTICRKMIVEELKGAEHRNIKSVI